MAKKIELDIVFLVATRGKSPSNEFISKNAYAAHLNPSFNLKTLPGGMEIMMWDGLTYDFVRGFVDFAKEYNLPFDVYYKRGHAGAIYLWRRGFRSKECPQLVRKGGRRAAG